MFTGIITAIGTIESTSNGIINITSPYTPNTIPLGASIACDGCCLTVTAVAATPSGGSTFTVEASNETLNLTTLSTWKTGTHINLERSLKLGDELGGHIVSGHVDGIAEIVSITPDGTSKRFEIRCPQHLAPFIAAKGSVALDGTSLTVNTVTNNHFNINIIPHTQQVTTWGEMTPGRKLNLEIDLLARYVARLHQTKAVI